MENIVCNNLGAAIKKMCIIDPNKSDGIIRRELTGALNNILSPYSGEEYDEIVQYVIKRAQFYKRSRETSINKKAATILLDLASVASTNKSKGKSEISPQSEKAKAEFNEKVKVGDSSFLYPYFGIFSEAKNAFQKNFEVELVNSILLDKKNKRFITTVKQLNDNIKDLQNSYVKVINEYLKSEGRTPISLIYQKDSKVLKTIKDVFDEETLDFFQTGWINENLNRIIINKNLPKYRAYQAFVALMNFDNLLKSILGKAINIEREGVFDGREGFFNYNIISAASMIQSWMTDDDSYNSIDELSNVVKLLISTLPAYEGNVKINGKYMEFNNVQQLYSTILKLSSNNLFSKLGQNVIPEMSLGSNDTLTLDSIKKWLENSFGENCANYYMVNYVKGKTIQQIITATRKNPTIGLPILFYILNGISDKLLTDKYINSTEYNTLKGLFYNVFDLNGTSEETPICLYSIKQDGVTQHDKNFYNCICQTLISAAGINRFQESLKGDSDEIVDIKDSRKQAQLRAIIYGLNSKFSIQNPNTFQYTGGNGRYELKYGFGPGKPFELTYRNIRIVQKTQKVGETIGTLKDSFDIYKDDKLVDSHDVYFTYGDYTNLIGLFSEVLGLDFDNPSFSKTLLNTWGGSLTQANKITENLLDLTASVLYTYSVNRKIHKENPNITAKDFASALKKYFNNPPKIRRKEDAVQSEIILSNRYSMLLTLAQVQQTSDGNSSEGTGKDGGGSQLSLQGLNMLATILSEQFQEYNSQPDSATKGFSILKNFNGLTFKRGVDSWDGFKNSVDYSASEHFASSFLYDFWGSIERAVQDAKEKKDNNRMILIHSAVISDKFNIPYIQIPISLFGTVTNDGFKFYDDFTPENLIKTISKEFGDYYYNIINSIIADFNQLDSIFDPTDNFREVNKLAMERFPDSKGKRKKLIKELLHDYIAYHPGVEIIEGLHYFFTKDGRISTNPTLINQLFRWGKLGNQDNPNDFKKYIEILNSENLKDFQELYEDYDSLCLVDESDLPEQSYLRKKELEKNKDLMLFDKYYSSQGKLPLLLQDYNIHETAEQFWQRKNTQTISDLIQMSPKPITLKRSGKNKKGLKSLTESLNGWTIGDNMILFKLKNSKSGKSFNITSQLDLRKWSPLEMLMDFSGEDIDKEKTDISNAKFDLQYTIDKINENWNNLRSSSKLLTLSRKIRSRILKGINLDEVKVNKSEKALKNLIKKEYINYFGNDEGFDEKYNENKINYTTGTSFRDNLLKYALLHTNKFYKENSYDLNYLQKNEKVLLQQGLLEENDLKNIQEIDDTQFSIELNPEIVRYNMIDFWMGEEFTCATVGTFANHPFKNNPFKTDIRYIEAEQYGQETKRTVTITASKHAYARGLINGIKKTYNIAVVEDPVGPVYNIYGKRDDTSPYDGATFINSLTANLQNNSLGDQAVGEEIKPISHSQNFKTGSGVIVKTAGFIALNTKIRDCSNLSELTEEEFNEGKVSGFYAIMNKHMNDIIWTDGNGNEKVYDWSIDYNQNKIEYKSVYTKNPYNGKHYLITATFDNATKNTTIIKTLVDERGNIQYDRQGNAITEKPEIKRIKSNWQLWKFVFGGEYSEHIGSDGKLTYGNDNTSTDNLTKAAIMVGDAIHDRIISSDDVWQPLKECAIDYVVTAGAIKQGAANINSIEMFTNPDYKVTTMKLKTFDTGIQLNSEHTADEAEVSLMTQVVNALGARGYSSISAQEIYEALNYLSESAIYDIVEGLDVYLQQGDINNLKNAVLATIVGTLDYVSASDGNLLNAISAQLNNNFGKDGNFEYTKIIGSIPLSHPAIYNQIIRKFASDIEKRAVRIKFPGGMNVLNPSNGIYQIVGGAIKGKLSAKEIQELQDEADAINLKPSQIKLERTYDVYEKDGTVNEVTINDPTVLWELRQRMYSEPDLQVHEDIKVGRDLGTYDASFTVLENGEENEYTLFDLKSIHDCYRLEDQISDLSEKLSQTQKGSEEYETIKQNLDAATNDLKLTRRTLQKDLNALGSGNNNKVTVIGKGNVPKTVIVQKVSIDPYEVILSKNYATTFGLRVEDDLNVIANDKYFFLRRTLEDLVPRTSASYFDIELKTPSKVNNLYLIQKGDTPINGALTKFTKLETEWDGKSLWRLNERKERMYAIPYINTDNTITPDITIYTDPNGVEIIETSNIEFFLNQFSFNSIQFGRRLYDNFASDEVVQLINSLKNFKNKLVRSFASEFNGKSLDKVEAYENYITNFNNQLEELLKNPESTKITSPYFKELIGNSIAIHTSFLQSLEYIASRTPAQSHQSFMTMKVVGFDDRGKNTAYVSRWQIWLQGSDYDIDKASMLGYAFNRGKLVTWGPYFNFSSIEALKNSEKWPFPTGKSLNQLNSEEIQQQKKRAFDYMSVKDINLEITPDQIKYSFNDGTSIIINIESLEDKSILHLENSVVIPSLKERQSLFVLDSKKKYILANSIKNLLEGNVYITSDNWYDLEKLGLVEVEDGLYSNSGNYDYNYDIQQYLNIFVLDLTDDIENYDRKNLIDNPDFQEIVRVFNHLDFYPNELIQNDTPEQKVLKDVLTIINYHNNYFEINPGKKALVRDALMNFISSRMAAISASPENLIQGQSGVDAEVSKVGKIIQKPEYSKLAAQTQIFDRGAITSKFKQLVLTLSGKQNVGVVASAMKVFEAMSQYYYQILNQGTKEEQENLLSNFKILGKEIKLIANSAVRNTVDIKSRKVYEALQEVNNDLDAFLLFSAFLSMATDNAKDPKLAKINAGPSMMGMYTAGFVLGLDLETLISIALSKTGLIINQIQDSNIFEEDTKYNRISQAIDYLNRGPDISYLKDNEDLIKLICKTININSSKFTLSDIKEAIKNPRKANQVINSLRTYLKTAHQEDEEIIKELPTVEEAASRISREISYKIRKLNKDLARYKSESKINKVKEQIQKLEQKRLVCKQVLEGTLDPENIPEIKELTTLSGYKQFAKVLDNSNNRKLLRQFCQDIDLYTYYLEQIDGDVILGEDGKEYKILNVIKKLDDFNQEMGMLRTVLKLNQGIPNGLEDQQTFINNFETNFKTFWTKEKETENLKALQVINNLIFNGNNKITETARDSKDISFKYFVTNPYIKDIFGRVNPNDPNSPYKYVEKYGEKYMNIRYGDFVRLTYNDLKIGVNIYDVMWGVQHYRGYLKAMNAVHFGLESVMNIYKKSTQLTKIVENYYGKASQSESNKRNKVVTSFIIRKTNNEFLHNIPINTDKGPIILGTIKSNTAFRNWMEQEVFPKLREQYRSNIFLKSLTTTTYNFNPKHNTTINYTSKVSMTPKSEYEIAKFARVKNSLNSLMSKKYGEYSIPDLIFLYNLIVYNGVSSQYAFTNLFEDIVVGRKSDIVNLYTKFISENDLNNNEEVYSRQDIEELLAQVAPIESISNLISGKKKPKRAWVQDETTMKYYLVEKVEESNNSSQDSDMEDFGIDPRDLGIDNDEGDDPMDEAGYDLEDEEESTYSNRKSIQNLIDSKKYRRVEQVDTTNLDSAVLVSYATQDLKKTKEFNGTNYKVTLDRTGKVIVTKNDETVDKQVISAKLKINDSGIIGIEVDIEKTDKNSKQKLIWETNGCL